MVYLLLFRTVAGGAAVESSTAFGVTYTGVEGLSVSYGEGEAASTDAAKQADLTSMKVFLRNRIIHSCCFRN